MFSVDKCDFESFSKLYSVSIPGFKKHFIKITRVFYFRKLMSWNSAFVGQLDFTNAVIIFELLIVFNNFN